MRMEDAAPKYVGNCPFCGRTATRGHAQGCPGAARPIVPTPGSECDAAKARARRLWALLRRAVRLVAYYRDRLRDLWRAGVSPRHPPLSRMPGRGGRLAPGGRRRRVR